MVYMSGLVLVLIVSSSQVSVRVRMRTNDISMELRTKCFMLTMRACTLRVFVVAVSRVCVCEHWRKITFVRENCVIRIKREGNEHTNKHTHKKAQDAWQAIT